MDSRKAYEQIKEEIVDKHVIKINRVIFFMAIHVKCLIYRQLLKSNKNILYYQGR